MELSPVIIIESRLSLAKTIHKHLRSDQIGADQLKFMFIALTYKTRSNPRPLDGNY